MAAKHAISKTKIIWSYLIVPVRSAVVFRHVVVHFLVSVLEVLLFLHIRAALLELSFGPTRCENFLFRSNYAVRRLWFWLHFVLRGLNNTFQLFLITNCWN